MLRITIKKELEKRLRGYVDQGSEINSGAIDLVKEVVAVLDAELEKRGTGSSVPGLGYKELVSLLRLHLGDDLVLPPAAAPTWIIRTVNKAREQGISKDNVEQIVRGLRRGYPRGPYELGFIVNRAGTHYGYGRVATPGIGVVASSDGDDDLQPGRSVPAGSEPQGETKCVDNVYTGRGVQDEV